jgi:hypothetical protein
MMAKQPALGLDPRLAADFLKFNAGQRNFALTVQLFAGTILGAREKDR